VLNGGGGGLMPRSGRSWARLVCAERRSPRLRDGMIWTRQHIYQWRAELRKLGEGLSGGANFLPVEMSTAASMSVAAPAVTSVEIVLADGRRLRGIEGLSPAGLTQLIRVLESA